MTDVRGRVVAITGASAGIGRACAERLVDCGAAVALLARRADRLQAIAEALTARGGRVVCVTGDVTHEPDVRALVERAVAAFGRLDVMICNAGIGYHGDLASTSADIARRLFDVNVIGTHLAARAAHEQFQRQGAGHIIAISSIAGRRGVGGMCAYSATKAAQIGYIEALRAEFFGTDMHASVVYPISTPTEFLDAELRDYGTRISAKGPRQSVDEVADAILACIRRPRAEVYPYRKAWWLAVLSVIAPARTDAIMQKYKRTAILRDAS